jgi:hypothetical protein
MAVGHSAGMLLQEHACSVKQRQQVAPNITQQTPGNTHLVERSICLLVCAAACADPVQGLARAAAHA